VSSLGKAQERDALSVVESIGAFAPKSQITGPPANHELAGARALPQ
jgi:hypothetical protein